MDMTDAQMQEASTVKKSEGLDAVSVGRVLKEGRNRAGLTRNQVEEKTGIGRNRLYRLENGIFQMRINEIFALCSLYGIPYSAVMAGYEAEVGTQGGGESRGAGESQADAPAMEACEKLQQAASLLGLAVVPEREGSDVTGPGIKVDPGEAISLEAKLDNLAELTKGKPNGVDQDKLSRRIDDMLGAAKDSTMPELLDAAEKRGVDFKPFEDASEDENGLLEPDGIRGLDSDDLHETLARLLVVHAVYGVDPFQLPFKRLGKVIEALQDAPEHDADAELGGGELPVPGRKISEVLARDQVVRNRMARELLPFLLHAAKTKRAPTRVMKVQGGER